MSQLSFGGERQKIVPHLWFDDQAKEAARFYTCIFEDSRMIQETTIHDTPSGSVDVVVFELFGQEFMAISAGPLFPFNESVSFMVKCDTQEEIDRYWAALTRNGGEEGQCGWLKDKFGLSWQISAAVMDEMMRDENPEKVASVVQAFLQMTKLDIAQLQEAFDR